MGFRINTNIAAMVAHSNGVMNNRSLDESLSKLSSGLRINKAADDASGMVIANSLRNQANSLGQAIANGNDAIGLIQTADGALNEYAKILDTIKTKSVQAASDGQNTSSRLAIQKDIDRLKEELSTIAKTTSFNGQKLLSGTFVNKEFQMGANANETVKSSIASAEPSQIGQTSRATLEITKLGENQLTLKSGITGKELTLEPINLKLNNDPANGMGAVADQINRYSGETGISAKAIVKVTTKVAISAGVTGIDFTINGVSIGSINVLVNDSQGTLSNAVNAKTSQTGVFAVKTEDGKMTLQSHDGRAINVTGNISEVMGSTADEMSTFGNIEVVQAGSSTFQIKGVSLSAAVGRDITITGSMVTIQDSTLTAGSTISTASTLGAGSTLGLNLSATVAMESISSTRDGILAVGSTIGSGATLNNRTELASKISVRAAATLSSDMLIKAGSTLTTGTRFDAGTVLQQDITSSGSTYKTGTVLAIDLILTASVTLSKDMVMSVDIQSPNATIGASSTLMEGSVLGADIITTGSSVLGSNMIMKAGTALVSGSILAAGSTIADALVLSDSTYLTTIDMTLKTGSTLTSASILKESSTIGGDLTIRTAGVLNQDMLLKAGSSLAVGSILKAGTVLTQDLTDAQIGGGGGVGLKSGTTLGADITTTAAIFLVKDMIMTRGTSATFATIAAGSTLALNTGNQNSVDLSNEKFTNLSTLDVTTLEGAMKAIDTLNAAITNLDTIRSDLGSVQNQIVSTINNISVTQVNVRAAESQIRDVDFAAESANFSKYNILAQSGSYAMSQANAVQQNVLSLLK